MVCLFPFLHNLNQKDLMMETRISVIGAGYVGLVTAACFAELGYQVICVEINKYKLSKLKIGESTIHETNLNDIIYNNIKMGRLVFTDLYEEAIPLSDFTFITVNTPSSSDGNVDTSFVSRAVDSILQNSRQRSIIVVKSTVPVGTGDMIEKLARQTGLTGVQVVSNPEFLREGSAVADFMHPDRILIGTADKNAGNAVANLYSAINSPIIICSRRSAEIAKYASNALLATRISFMNEMANICSSVNADIQEVEHILGTDKRIGPAFLKAGIGWGGPCFPKDLQALAAVARSNGLQALITEATIKVNARQQQIAIDCLKACVNEQENATVGVLGLAFKSNTDDIRESPALAVVVQLLKQGIAVRAHDPLAMDNARKVFQDIKYFQDPYDVALGCDGILLATEWPQYLLLDWGRIRLLMRGNVIIDGRNILDINSLSSLGFKYISFGRRIPSGHESC